MGFEANIVNTFGIIFEILGVIILLTGVKRLELKRGGFGADHYVDSKTQEKPKVLTLPNEMKN